MPRENQIPHLGRVHRGAGGDHETPLQKCKDNAHQNEFVPKNRVFDEWTIIYMSHERKSVGSKKVAQSKSKATLSRRMPRENQIPHLGRAHRGAGGDPEILLQ
ncbi:predicted protein [Arabidopsis lyrata subsp. lyrata]|uniref:Predicted protein n=1 Tax=Arabidopsis lyrata subsp. lyrata TaxID=81972 RepID=D7KAV4_ARALL|nr:predicted protein [Arabidopsis lyrata subsp. lyrata]